MTMENLFIGVISSLVAAGIIALLSRTSFGNSTAQRSLRAMKRLFPPLYTSLGNKLREDPNKAIEALVHWLGNDQSKSGLHFGQFGSGANLKEEKLFQTSREQLEAKPRLYLTGWPCFVLHNLGRGSSYLQLAVKGIERLLQNGPIRVSLGASEKTPPDRQPTIISYRHTIRAVQILAKLEANNKHVHSVLGLMLDERNDWQNLDGGWKQCNKERTDSDLWGSAYAVAFLSDLLNTQVVLTGQAKNRAQIVIPTTIEYLKKDWGQTRWSYGKASSEQNGVQIFHETFNSLKRYDEPFIKELRQWVRGWLSPTGSMSMLYYEACDEVSLASANVRIAYALFLAGEPQPSWEPLVLEAVDRFDEGVNSADASFLLHLIAELSRSGLKLRG